MDPGRLAEIYPRLAKISVDYAVMEPVSLGRTDAHVVAVQLPITWHDVGGFPSLRGQLPWDEHGNALSGTTVVVGSRDNLVLNECADGRLLAAVGMHDTVMVQTDQITVDLPDGRVRADQGAGRRGDGPAGNRLRLISLPSWPRIDGRPAPAGSDGAPSRAGCREQTSHQLGRVGGQSRPAQQRLGGGAGSSPTSSAYDSGMPRARHSAASTASREP